LTGDTKRKSKKGGLFLILLVYFIWFNGKDEGKRGVTRESSAVTPVGLYGR
jgi:hypothetical protein